MTNVQLAEKQQKRNQMISSAAAVPVDATLSQDQSPTQVADKQDENFRRRELKQKWWLRTRMHVALLGLTIAAVNCYAQATFCIAIVEMVLPADYKAEPTVEGAIFDDDDNDGNLFSNDQSCPIEYKYRDYYDNWRFPSIGSSAGGGGGFQTVANASTRPAAQAASSQTIDVSNRFDWDASQQGLLLGAFAVGTAPLQIAGGRLAEIYGSKWVLLMGCIGTGLTNLAIPYLAHFSFLLLLVNRVVMGIAQAGMEPGLMCLLADWLTPQEAGFFISMLLFAICLGFFLGSLCSSFILGLSYGWPLTYYVSGGLNLLVALVWFIYADSWPRASKYISEEELRFIENEQHKSREQQVKATATCSSTTKDLNKPKNISSEKDDDDDEEEHRQIDASAGNKIELPAIASEPLADAPWLNILSSRPVWAFIICKISIRWCADVLSNELPTYLANVLHLSIKFNGLLNSVSTALFAISSFVTGWLATSELCMGGGSETIGGRQDANRSKTRLRKCFQSLASFGSALCLILMTQFDCDLLLSMSMLLVLSCCLVMGTGGELQIPYDMTSKYPGTLHGLACTLSVSGWLAPPLIGLILGDQPSSRSRWAIVWYSTAAINLLGGLIFVLFADASPRDFDYKACTTANKRRNKSPAPDYGDLEDGRRGEQQQQQQQQQQHHNDRGYINDGLHNSSCESSPKSSHQHYNQVRGANGAKALNPLDASITFDCGKLIKCRQFESSFIQPTQAFQINRYLQDSPLRQDPEDLIHPYREQQQQQQQQRHPIDCFAAAVAATAGKQTASSKLQALESKERPSSWSSWHRRLFASKKRHSATINTQTQLANEKFMPNERAVTTTTTNTTTITSETINHLRGSHDKHSHRLNVTKTGGSATTAPNQMVDKLNGSAHALHPDTNHPPPAATTMDSNISLDRQAGSDGPLATNFDNHDHHGDIGRVPPNSSNEFELNPNSLLMVETFARQNNTITHL